MRASAIRSSKPRKSKDYRRHRLALAEAQNWRCAYCSASLDYDATTVDHVVAVKRQGPGTWDNLVSCCSPCNDAKKHTNAYRFFWLRQRGITEGWWLPGDEINDIAIKHLRALWRAYGNR